MRDKIKLFLSGCLMGVSDAIPGVSGATIALLLGIYKKLISSISSFFSNLWRPVKLLKSKEFSFLVNLYSGVVLTLILSLIIIGHLIEKYPSPIFSFFTGLIVGSILIISYRHGEELSKGWLFCIIGFLVGFLILSFDLLMGHSLLITFISGILAISAMVLPGISGSYILLMLNQYQYIIGRIREIDIGVLAIFILGIVIGLFTTSKVLDRLLKKYKAYTISFLIGLMAGGLRAPISKVESNISLVIFGLIGFFSIFLVSKWYKE